MKSILIIGGAGEIGSHLEIGIAKRNKYIFNIFDKERKNNPPPNYFRGDINDIFSLEYVFQKTKPDIVIHLAAMVSRKECEETPSLAIQTNAIGTLNVVKMCIKYHAYLIYSGSSEEYGESFYNGNKVTEDTPFGTPTSVYSMTKRFSEEIIQYYAEHDSLSACTIRLFMLYSEDEPSNNYRSAISRFCYSAAYNIPLNVHEGTERSWCHIDDAIDAIVHIIEKPPTKSYDVFLIGRDDPILTTDLATTIIRMFNSKSEIIYVRKDPTIIPIKRGDFSKMKQMYKWEAKITLTDGIQRIVNKYR